MTSTMSSLIVSFPGSIAATLDRVGGKGQSLIKMTQLGLPVPPGIVLTVDFFADWVDDLKLSEEWNEFAKSTSDSLKSACDNLKQRALKLSFSATKRELLNDAVKSLDSKRLMAVRSSSPSEDLEGTSFAGGYDTILGVNKETLEDAVKKAFTSCLDFRVVTYKLHHGFAIDDPRIAVVIQEQIDSTVSGVAFSINPINNDFDEAVFNANWGLGETVVSGVCTPDTIIVNKHTMRVVEKLMGLKETSITLKSGGGTSTEGETEKSKRFCISDGHVLSLTRYVKTLEEVFRTPIDVEWALEKDREYILQARPVTSYVPLSDKLLTKPGERRKLYLDATLSVQAMEKPLSRMQISMFNQMGKIVGKKLTGNPLINESGRTFVYATDGRLYLVVSHFLQLYGANLVSRFIENVDPITAKTILEADEKKYKSHELWVSMALLKALPGYLKKAPEVLNARMFPAKGHEQAQQRIERFKNQIKRIIQSRAPVYVIANRILECSISAILEGTFPVFIASRIALERIKQTIKGAPEELVRNLELALPYNVTVEMGLSLYRISQALSDKDAANPPNYDLPIESQLSPEAAALWTDFIHTYGHRGPGELDIAAPRYREQPQMLYEQVLALKNASQNGIDPVARYERNLQLRERAYDDICQFLENDSNRLRRFQSLYRVWSTLGGYRETHKFLLIYGLDAIRTLLLEEADQLVSKGRLERREQIFDLSLADLASNLRDKQADLVEIGQNNRKFTDRLARVPRLPALIDSRGRILRKKAEPTKEGEISGTAVSQGQVRGRVKVLHSPDEKPFLHGEILVARATDPGWTPLFVNAAAVILEVGGLLQHGALVAREYGLPCVSGITNATSIFHDGMMVEVDGSNGIVRPLTPVEQGSTA